MNALGTEGICPICSHDTFVVGRLSSYGLTFTPQDEWTVSYPRWVNGRACQRCGYLQLFVELPAHLRERPLASTNEPSLSGLSAPEEPVSEAPTSLKDRLKSASEEWFADNEP